jgi:aminoglycoside N3'-acetyltransferase
VTLNIRGMRTFDQFVADLTHLGIRPNQALMVHASLRAIGPVEGGAHAVVKALDAAVGPSGAC